jgi:hypothetical protein
MKLVTPSALVERLKINSSLARAACKFLAEVKPSLTTTAFALQKSFFLTATVTDQSRVNLLNS